ncbi:non-specific serine/threonine protein kinase [Ranunculus cassubicifolius]
MKCFHFSSNERGGGERRDHHHHVDDDDDDGVSSTRVSRVSWARSLSIASSTADTKRSADNNNNYSSDNYSRDLSDSATFHEFLSQRRANDLRVFGFNEMKLATRGFSRSLMIGEGGFGSVYRGLIKDEDSGEVTKLDVAVKQLNRNGLQGHKEWVTEVNCLGVVKHPNLVKLVGYCAEDDERGIQRLLVYELMPNKSLEDHLLSRVQQPLPWNLRLKIAHGAACGLAYLHEEMDFQLIFRDFKTSNILLDEDFNAKLSDFGLARQGPSEGLGHVSTSVVGTVGYAAPEYVQTGRLTVKSDVWSFGVVLYELITGRRSVDRNLPKNEQKLLEWVKPYVSGGTKRIHLIMDPQLQGDYGTTSAQKLVSLANKCLMKQPKSRPKMSEVVEILGQIMTVDGEVVLQQAAEEVEVVKEKEAKLLDTEGLKHGSSYRKMVFDLKEIIGSRNRSVGRLDWRNWAPVVRTW